MRHILLTEWVPAIGGFAAILTFVIIGLASFGYFKRSVIEADKFRNDTLTQAIEGSKTLAGVAIGQLNDLKSKFDAIVTKTNLLEKEIIRVAIDLERKTRFLDASRADNDRLERIVGITVAALPPDHESRKRAEILLAELVDKRRAWTIDQSEWEDEQTAMHLYLGDGATNPVDVAALLKIVQTRAYKP